MKFLLLFCMLNLIFTNVTGYWDTGTTTSGYVKTDNTPRQSFFKWQCTHSENMAFFFYWWDWKEIRSRRRLNVIAGISIDFLCLGTATILNRRTLITSANYLDPWFNRQRDLRIWALGKAGTEITPYRYRVWRLTRLFPKSMNPEHWHGPRGIHSPRHDVLLIHSLDMIYLHPYRPTKLHHPYKAILTWKQRTLRAYLWFAGSGFENMQHIAENYQIIYADALRSTIVDCSIYLPKFWGKFICFKNIVPYAGIQNGGGLFDSDYITGIGCFEIRYNEDRIIVFTDIRYYVDYIFIYAYIWWGQYYEYAYPQWGQKLGVFSDSVNNYPYIPTWQVQNDLFPLGKK